MVTVITSPAISLQTFNTATKGGDAMASTSHHAPTAHQEDSSDSSIKVTRTSSSPDAHAGLMRIVFPTADEMIARCLSGTYPRMTQVPYGGSPCLDRGRSGLRIAGPKSLGVFLRFLLFLNSLHSLIAITFGHL